MKHRLLPVARLSLPLAIALAALAAPLANATTITWDANAGTPLQTDGAGAWLTANQWWNGSANVNWTSGDDAIFGNSGAGGAVTLASPTTVNSLTFNSFTGTYTLGTAGQTITLNNGITMNSGAGAATIISPITLGAAQSWTNNSASLLTIGTGAVTNAGNLLTIGGTGNTTVSSAIGGTGGLTKNGAGTLTLSGTNTYSGATTLAAGTLLLAHTNAVAGSSTLNLADSTTLQLRSDTSATFNVLTSTVPVSATVTIDVNNNGSGSGNTLTMGTVTVAPPPSLQAIQQKINITGGNGYTLRIPTLNWMSPEGSGTKLTLNATNASVVVDQLNYSFGGGSQGIILDGTSTGNVISNASSTAWMTLDKQGTGTWTWGVNCQATGGLGNSGGGISAGTLIVNGSIWFAGGGRYWTMSGGTLCLNSANAIGNNGANLALIITGGNLDNTSGAPITMTSNPVMNWSGNFTFLGSQGANSDLNLGTGAMTLTTSPIVTVNSNATLTVGGAISGAGFGLTKAGTGTLSLSGTNTYTGTTTVSGGKLAVNGSLASASSVTVQNGGTLQGRGSIGGSVTIQNGGTLATGNSIESLATGALSLQALATFAQEINKDAAATVAGDLTAVTGNLTIDLGNTAILTLTELGSGSWSANEKLTLISYSGTWNGGLFNYGGTLADDSTINFSGATWQFNYNDTVAGSNYTSDLTGTSFVTMTVIPEPNVAALLGGLGTLLLLRRRRS